MVGFVLLGPRVTAPPASASAPAVLSIRSHEYPEWVRRVVASPPRSGQKGTAVLAVQRLLLSLGYDLTLDGVYGPRTTRALQQFQQQSKLSPTGQANRATVEHLVSGTWWYPVKPGDTLGGIASLYGTTVQTLRSLNGLTGTTIRAGQRLLVPRAGIGGTITEWGRYRVRRGDTLWSVARRFKVSQEDLQRANAILDPRSLTPGQMLWLPARSPQPQEGTRLSWPVTGPITSGYGWRHSPFDRNEQEFHEGLDIAVPVGTPVRAAASGVVVQAGWMGGFGYGVVIAHGGDLQTLYGHLKRIRVQVGQQVKRGEVIAWSGSTGRSTGPHLDFRVKQNDRPVNPLSLLPPR